MKNNPKISAAKPTLDALTAGLAKTPAASAETLALHFDASKPGHTCAACAGDEVLRRVRRR
jgi:hypothetical protein